MREKPIGIVECNYEEYMKYEQTYHLFVRIACGDARVLSATPKTLTVHIPTNHGTGVIHHDEVIPFAQPEHLWVGARKDEEPYPRKVRMPEDLKVGQQVRILVHGREGEDLFGEIATIAGKNVKSPNLYDALLPNDATPIQVFAHEVTLEEAA